MLQSATQHLPAILPLLIIRSKSVLFNTPYLPIFHNSRKNCNATDIAKLKGNIYLKLRINRISIWQQKKPVKYLQKCMLVHIFSSRISLISPENRSKDNSDIPKKTSIVIIIKIYPHLIRPDYIIVIFIRIWHRCQQLLFIGILK